MTYSNDYNKPDEMLAKVEFHQSKSKLYKRAVSIAKSFPLYEERDGVVCCAIVSILDYCRLQRVLRELIKIVSKWKQSNIFFWGKQYKTGGDYYEFLRRVKAVAGKYAPLIVESESNVSLGQISIENLPYPIVYYPPHYGAFFAFAKDIGEPIVFCECERTAIQNYILLRKKKPLINYTGDKTNPLGTDFFPTTVSRLSKGVSDPLSIFEFKEGICFRCNKLIPSYTYCLPMYGGSFKQHYGWYIQQEYFRLGIDKYQFSELSVLEDVCDSELYDSLKRLRELSKKLYADSSIEEKWESKKLWQQIDNTIENSVRVQLGFKKIGDSWISETILFGIVQQIFDGSEIVRHYRPNWLEGLELDVYVPDHNIAFEYQGIQHFVAVKHWGGEAQLQKQKEHDARKKKICLERGVNLICINYNDPLTTEFVLSCIKDYGEQSLQIKSQEENEKK